MEVQPQCYPCFLRQAVDITELTNADPQRSIAIIEEAMRLILSRHDMDTPPSFVGFLYEQLHQVFFSDQHIFDPYKDIKQKTTDHALNLVDHLRTFVHSSDDPLLAAVTTAIAGNVIDFGASKADTIDIDKEVQELHTIKFAHNDIHHLKNIIDNVKTILYICDNAGEIVFDRVFMEYLHEILPGVKIIAAVRDKPILNDAVKEDALCAGVDKVATIISNGSHAPGILFPNATPEFMHYFESADLVFSKGQGNFETLYPMDRKGMFYLFKVKCSCVSKVTGFALGTMVFKAAWNEMNTL